MASLNNKDDLKTFSELRGNTLLVYLHMVKSATPVGVREVQRKLDFSSPTLAAYHLEKLENMGLAQKTPDGYILAKEVKVGVLSQVVKFGSLLLPRYVFYTVLFSTLLACYLVFIWLENTFELNIHSSFAILLGATIIAVMAYECVRIWRQKPF